MSPATLHALNGERIEPITVLQAVERFIERIRLRGYANNTLRSYSATLVAMAEYLDSRDITLIGLLSERMVDGWLDHLGRAGNSVRSQAHKMATLRSLLDFARREGWLRHDPTEGVRLKFRPGRVIAPELDRILDVINAIPRHTAADVRDRAMLRLGLDAALRISEVCALDLHDPSRPPQCCVDLKRLQVHVAGKGGGVDTVGINERTAREVEAWLRVRGALAGEGETSLFVSRLGGRFTRAQLHNIVRRRGDAVGIDHLHWHMLRHRRVGDIVERIGLDAGQLVARHANKSTTANVYGAHANEVVRSLIREKCDLDRMGVAA